MSRSAKPRTHADKFKKLEYKRPKDVDPEHDFDVDSDAKTNDSDSDVDQADTSGGREHYEAIVNSELRAAQDVDAVGPQYTGLRISRKRAFSAGEEHDPFVEFDYDGTGEEEERGAGMSSKEPVKIHGGRTNGSEEFSEEEEDESNSRSDGNDESEDSEMEGSGEEPDEALDGDIDRDQLRRMMVEDRTNIASTIARATQIDAEKGRAVKKQKATFDSLLNIRIKLQSSLISTNSMCIAREKADEDLEELQQSVETAEKAAIKMIGILDEVRQTIRTSEAVHKPKALKISPNSGSRLIWNYIKNSDSQDLPRRRKTLQKWSNKTQGVNGLPSTQKLQKSNTQGSITDVINDQLLGIERLVKRTRLPRSCAPLHISEGIAESNEIYDDADFYGIMLKELLEQRSIDASNVQTDTIAQHWRAVRQAKTKKQVDIKASKGRRIRYTIHEKLQNFMAPENRGSWGHKQIDDLFGSLLGKKMVLSEVEQDNEEGMDGIAGEQEALMLFRN